MYYNHLVMYYHKRRKVGIPIDLFTLKMVILGKVELEDFHRVVGKFYGFPKCCVENYVRLMEMGVPPALYMHEVFTHRHPLPLVLCNDCHNIYQQYVGSDHVPNFHRSTTAS